MTKIVEVEETKKVNGSSVTKIVEIEPTKKATGNSVTKNVEIDDADSLQFDADDVSILLFWYFSCYVLS